MISKSALQRGVERLAVESGGLVKFIGIQKRDEPVLVADVLNGCPEAQRVLRAVVHARSKIAGAPKRRPMLCATCPKPLRDGDKYAVVVVFGAVDDPSEALTMAVCNRCGPTPGAINAAAAVGLRSIFPDARTVEPTHKTGGRA